MFKWPFMSITPLRAGCTCAVSCRHPGSFPLNDRNINTSILCWSALGTADPDPNQRGKKAVRKTTQAGGGGAELMKIAAEQSEKLQKDRDERMERIEQMKQIQAEEEAAKEEEKPAEEQPAAPEPPKPKPKPQPQPKQDPEGPIEEPEPEPKPEPEVKEEKPKSEEAAPHPTEEEPTKEEPRKRVRTGPLVPDTIIGKLTVLIY